VFDLSRRCKAWGGSPIQMGKGHHCKATRSKDVGVVVRSDIERLQRLGRGCRYCTTGQCYVMFAKKIPDLVRWREEFLSLPAAVREQHLCWLFWHRPIVPDKLSNLKSGDCQDRCNTSSEDDGDSDPHARSPAMHHMQETRDDTTPSASEEELDIVCGDGRAPERVSVPKAKRRRYGTSRQQRHGRFSVALFGQSVCVKAAQALIGVGQGQLYRIKHGLADGRRDGTKGVRGRDNLPLNAPKLSSVLRFLWRLYQSVGEGMPDKFSFRKRDAKTLVLEPYDDGLRIEEETWEGEIPASDCSSEEATGSLRDVDEEERSITAQALFAESSRHPAEAILYGPGMPSGPLRLLPPTRRVHIYWEYVAWCQTQDCQVASFNTFLRAFQASRDKLRIRTAGEHAKCDICLKLKAHIRKQIFPKDRQAAIETYTRHVLDQWLDRQVRPPNWSIASDVGQHLPFVHARTKQTPWPGLRARCRAQPAVEPDAPRRTYPKHRGPQRVPVGLDCGWHRAG